MCSYAHERSREVTEAQPYDNAQPAMPAGTPVPGQPVPDQPMAGQPLPPPVVPGQTVLGGAPAPKRRGRQLVWIGVIVVVVLALVGISVFLNRNSPSGAKVGDCVHKTGTDSIEVVACTDKNAEFTVVGRVEDQTQVQAGLSSCDPYPDADQVFWSGEEGGTGYVLCLATKAAEN
jgi:hypothetical protein